MTERISDERARELGALEKAATKAPWERPACAINTVRIESGRITIEHDTHPDDAMDKDVLAKLKADADLVAEARNELPLLLLDRADLKAEIARLTWKLEAVRKVAEGYREAGKYDGSRKIASTVLAALDSEPPQSPSLDQK